MKKLTSLERIAKVVNLQEPDVIPHWELGIARNVIEAILPGASYRDFAEVKGVLQSNNFERSPRLQEFLA